ncbi:MAG: HD domain-containing protein [Lachnospiraceae bacterium]|nr:HD domain-containing protein [Lachnospiraceae bacterium]
MFEIPDNLRLINDEYYSVLSVIYVQVEKLLKNPLHIHYTDHSITHSIRIANIISQIIENIDVHFNEEEKFILLAALLLHDIGMQTPDYADLGELPLNIEGLEKIRKKHHEYSEKLIIDSIQCSEEEAYFLGLNSKEEFVDDIALVAKYHRKMDIAVLDNDVIGDKIIRLRLLCALIRLGDCLDLDYRRVNIKRLLVFTNIPIESKFYWYAHHYVSGLLIQTQKIHIYFKFPKQYESRDEFTNKIIEYMTSEIRNQIDEVYDILDEYNIRFYKDIKVNKQYSKAQKRMPVELEEYIATANAESVYRGVIYGKLNITNRKDLLGAYVQSLKNTESFRNMVMGPYFLAPQWYRERVNANCNHEDFDSRFFEFVRKKAGIAVNENIKLIFTNTRRYEVKVKDILTPSEYNRFFEDVLENMRIVWGEYAERGPMLCCVDPGYMHIITSADNCAIITQRAGIMDPTHQGYITTDKDEIGRINQSFDDIFNYNYSTQELELKKLEEFIRSVM